MQVGQNDEKRHLHSPKDIKPKKWLAALLWRSSSLPPVHPSDSSRPCCLSIWHSCRPEGQCLKFRLDAISCSVYIHLPCPLRNEYHCFPKGLYQTQIFLDMSIYLRPRRKVRDGQKYFKCDHCVPEKTTSPLQTMPTSVQFSHSVVSDSATPWTAGRQASLSIPNTQSLLKLMSIESVMPSSHLILCCPLLLLPSIFPSIRGFSNVCCCCC